MNLMNVLMLLMKPMKMLLKSSSTLSSKATSKSLSLSSASSSQSPLQSSQQVKPLRALIAAVAVCALSACYVYKIDIQQGNEITAQMLDKLQIGMRKTEVSELIGYPLVNDPFHEDRWDYYYYLKKGESGEVLQHSATLWFKEGALVKIDSALEKSGG